MRQFELGRRTNFGVSPNVFESVISGCARRLNLTFFWERFRDWRGLPYDVRKFSRYEVLSRLPTIEEMAGEYHRIAEDHNGEHYGARLFLGDDELLRSGVIGQEYGDASGDISGIALSFFTVLLSEDPLALMAFNRIKELHRTDDLYRQPPQNGDLDYLKGTGLLEKIKQNHSLTTKFPSSP